MDSLVSERRCGMGEGGAAGEIALVAQVAAGERLALAALYTLHHQAVFRYLLQLTPDRGLAEELLQDTFVAAWRGAGRFEGRSAVKTWLLGIARRQAHNALRGPSLLLDGDAALASQPATDPDPGDVVLAQAEQAQLAAALKRLPLIYREVLALAFIQELSSAEMAAVLGIPLGTVKSRLRNGKRALRDRLTPREELP